MLLKLFNDSEALAVAAAADAATAMQVAIRDRGRCRIVVATGASQFPFLESLTEAAGIDWNKVEAFHLDEYVGIPMTHPGSFRRMLVERLVNKTGITNYHFVEGDAPDLSEAVGKVGEQLRSSAVDVAFVGIGENGHIAFNDPPADFETADPYIVVELDEACRRQQVGEGWFAGLAQVPTRAISMSPRQILKARQIVAVVPDLRKAKAVRLCMEGDISPMAPASILRRHPNTTVYLDCDSASLLSPAVRKQLEEKSEVMLRA
ncbi:MAG: glucosamine-6-phosphate deaminase [Candidatus Sulfotelmatobacter sp.]